jgi:hypothetical protein
VPNLILFGILDAVKVLCLQICSVLCVYNSHEMVLEHRTTQQFLLSRIMENTILHARKINRISQLDQHWMDLSWNTIKIPKMMKVDENEELLHANPELLHAPGNTHDN